MTVAHDDDRSPLPPDLAELEKRLAERAAAVVPPARLRARVAAAVRAEFGGRAGMQRPWWQYAAAMAAVVLIGLNAAIAAAPSSPVARAPRQETGRVVRVSETIAHLVPGLTPREARALAVTSGGPSSFGGGVVPVEGRPGLVDVR